jgi:hypothetical protein
MLAAVPLFTRKIFEFSWPRLISRIWIRNGLKNRIRTNSFRIHNTGMLFYIKKLGHEIEFIFFTKIDSSRPN